MDTIGLNLYTAHFQQECTNVNPGIYFRHDEFVLGNYRNSACKNSTMLGYVFTIGRGFEVMVGGINGYPKYNGKYIPVVLPSYKYRDFRYTLLGDKGIHISYEYSFK